MYRPCLQLAYQVSLCLQCFGNHQKPTGLFIRLAGTASDVAGAALAAILLFSQRKVFHVK